MKRLAHKWNLIIGKIFGVQLKKAHFNADPIMDADSQFMEIYTEIQPYTMTSKARCYALYRAVNYILKNNIAGDFVECGVWRGGNALLIARILERAHDQNRNIWLYDTFAGMSEPTDVDRITHSHTNARRKWQQKNQADHNDWCYASLEEVKQNLRMCDYPPARVKFIKGPVETTIPDTVPEKICLLRLDTDWYESTKHELEHLYPLLIMGGVIIIDDYGSWEGARKAVDEYLPIGKTLLNRIDNTGYIGLKI